MQEQDQEERRKVESHLMMEQAQKRGSMRGGLKYKQETVTQNQFNVVMRTKLIEPCQQADGDIQAV